MKKDRNPIKPILSNPALNDEKVYNERRYTVYCKQYTVPSYQIFIILSSILKEQSNLLAHHKKTEIVLLCSRSISEISCDAALRTICQISFKLALLTALMS